VCVDTVGSNDGTLSNGYTRKDDDFAYNPNIVPMMTDSFDWRVRWVGGCVS